jgi:hypothetical protein
VRLQKSLYTKRSFPMSLIINLEIWFAQSLRVSRIWIKEIPIRKNKLWKNLEAPDSYGKSSNDDKSPHWPNVNKA